MNYTQHATQHAQISTFLRAGGRLTPLDALRQFGCLRLAAVVHSLRKSGERIDTEMIEVRTASGGTAHVARYSMPGAEPQGQLRMF